MGIKGYVRAVGFTVLGLLGLNSCIDSGELTPEELARINNKPIEMMDETCDEYSEVDRKNPLGKKDYNHVVVGTIDSSALRYVVPGLKRAGFDGIHKDENRDVLKNAVGLKDRIDSLREEIEAAPTYERASRIATVAVRMFEEMGLMQDGVLVDTTFQYLSAVGLQSPGQTEVVLPGAFNAYEGDSLSGPYSFDYLKKVMNAQMTQGNINIPSDVDRVVDALEIISAGLGKIILYSRDGVSEENRREGQKIFDFIIEKFSTFEDAEPFAVMYQNGEQLDYFVAEFANQGGDKTQGQNINAYGQQQKTAA